VRVELAVKCNVQLITLSGSAQVKVKGPDIYIPPLTGKPEQQRFTMQIGLLASISSRRCGAISGRQLPERTDFVLITSPTASRRRRWTCDQHNKRDDVHRPTRLLWICCTRGTNPQQIGVMEFLF